MLVVVLSIVVFVWVFFFFSHFLTVFVPQMISGTLNPIDV